MAFMTDPQVLSYSRRLYDEEYTEMGVLKISNDYMFDFGIYLTRGQTPKLLEVPESIGRFMTINTFSRQYYFLSFFLTILGSSISGLIIISTLLSLCI